MREGTVNSGYGGVLGILPVLVVVLLTVLCEAQSSLSSSSSWPVGPHYTVNFFSQNDACGFRVANIQRNGSVVFARVAPTCDNWITFATGQRTVEQHGGTFQFQDYNVDEECAGLTDIHVSSSSSSDLLGKGRVTMEATLTNASAATSCKQERKVTFSFVSGETTSAGLQFRLNVSTDTPPDVVTSSKSSQNGTLYTIPFEGVMMDFDTAPAETILGLGFQYTYLDLKGKENSTGMHFSPLL